MTPEDSHNPDGTFGMHHMTRAELMALGVTTTDPQAPYGDKPPRIAAPAAVTG